MTTTAPVATPAATPAATSGTSNTALTGLGSNVTDFLKLLMTQLQNQDPTAPMDVSTFTNQLVQFASVEQQINTNTNLQTLIGATQSNTVLQSSSLVGKQAVVTSDHLTLQGGTAAIGFTAPSAETVNLQIQAADGTKVLQTTVAAQAGQNQWTWNGKDADGQQRPDGSYKITVTDPAQTALATTATGTVTGVSRSGTSVQLSLGALDADVGTLQSVATQ